MKLIMVEAPPCPFCGSDELRTKVSTETHVLFRCDGCGRDHERKLEEVEVVGIAFLGIPGEEVTDYLSQEGD